MKRTKTRLDHLEIETGKTSLSPRAQKALVELLGRRDALFWPWRCTVDPKHLDPMPAILAKQRAYLDRSEGTLLKADGKGDWKLAQSVRAELVVSGLVDAVLSSGQVTSLVLTSVGEATARLFVGPRLRTCADVGILWERLLRLVDERSPVGESRLFGDSLHGDPTAWDDWTEAVLPLLTCGAVRATSNTVGAIFFSVTSQELPATPSVQIDPVGDAEGWYLQAFGHERIHLNTLEAGHELFIPLPAGVSQ